MSTQVREALVFRPHGGKLGEAAHSAFGYCARFVTDSNARATSPASSKPVNERIGAGSPNAVNVALPANGVATPPMRTKSSSFAADTLRVLMPAPSVHGGQVYTPSASSSGL